jgi:hypothetical protein
MEATNLSLSRKRAQQFKDLRAGLMVQLYPTRAVGTVDSQQNLLLGDLLSSFKRYAGNQKTAYDDGSVQTSPTSSTNLLERQVERALTQVLGRSPGRGATNFINALNATFPQSWRGQGNNLATSQSQMQAYSADGSGMTPDPSGVLSARSPEISSRQDALRRSTSIIMADALQLLDRLQAFVPQADSDRVEALRALVRTQIKVLIEEFGRIDEPRTERVEAYLSSLAESVTEFGKQAYFNDPMLAVTVEDEDQVTKFELLRTYVQMMGQAWVRYYRAETSGRTISLSERVDRARVLLPVVSQATVDFSNALESVGLSENERRSRASRFSTLEAAPIELIPPPTGGFERVVRNPASPPPTSLSRWLPNITVSDLIDWLDRYSNVEALSSLDSVYGIDFVTDQADRLFWTIAPIVSHLKTTIPLNSSSQSTLEQVLANERVSWALDNLLSQLNEVANLAA